MFFFFFFFFFFLWWDLKAHQPFWVILSCLLEKGRKEIVEIVEEMKERDREGRGIGMKVKKQKKYNYSPSILTCVRIAGLAQL